MKLAIRMNLQFTEVQSKEDNKSNIAKQDQSEDTKEQSTQHSSGKAASKTIRVNIERLDILLNLFEELVIDRGRLEQISSELNNQELARNS